MAPRRFGQENPAVIQKISSSGLVPLLLYILDLPAHCFTRLAPQAPLAQGKSAGFSLALPSRLFLRPLESVLSSFLSPSLSFDRFIVSALPSLTVVPFYVPSGKTKLMR